mgnify:CR=1 FL=1
MDILATGGGILSTVEATRNIEYKELLQKSLGSLYELASYGVTTMEVKSGYGLNRETEVKQLKIIKELNKTSKIGLYSIEITNQEKLTVAQFKGTVLFSDKNWN